MIIEQEKIKEAKKYTIEALIPIIVLFGMYLIIIFSIVELQWWGYVLSTIGMALEIIFSYQAIKPIFYYVCGVYGNTKNTTGLEAVSREEQEKKVRNSQSYAFLAFCLLGQLLIIILYNTANLGKPLMVIVNSIVLLALLIAMWLLAPIYKHFYCLD